MLEGRIHSAPVLSRVRTENAHDSWDHGVQTDIFQKFGKTRTTYVTIHTVLDELNCYDSKKNLVKSLTSEK